MITDLHRSLFHGLPISIHYGLCILFNPSSLLKLLQPIKHQRILPVDSYVYQSSSALLRNSASAFVRTSLINSISYTFVPSHVFLIVLT